MLFLQMSLKAERRPVWITRKERIVRLVAAVYPELIFVGMTRKALRGFSSWKQIRSLA